MSKSKHRSTQRFSKTIDYYHQYRPRYPQEVIQLIQKECNIDKASQIVDVGSGTGIFTKLLLVNGFCVDAVEPNREMRLLAEKNLSEFSRFKSLEGAAENIPIPNQSVDLITAAQAFHWFDPHLIRKEFVRILKPEGYVLLLWNLRDSSKSQFMSAYEKLLQTYGTDYKEVAAENISEAEIQRFFSTSSYRVKKIDNEQVLNLEGFVGRLLSTSYTPKPGDGAYDSMINAAEEIFNEYQKEGYVKLIYTTACYYGIPGALQTQLT